MGIQHLANFSMSAFNSSDLHPPKPPTCKLRLAPMIHQINKTRPAGRYTFQSLCVKETFGFSINLSKKSNFITPRCSNSPEFSSDSDGSTEKAKVPFGYSRKDVIFIGIGVTALGVGLKSGLEYFGVDPLQAGNVVQLVLVLGLTIGWISTYIFRVSNKEMTYAQQLRDYESQVMQKRLDGLTEAELEALLEQVDEDKRRLASGKQVK